MNDYSLRFDVNDRDDKKDNDDEEGFDEFQEAEVQVLSNPDDSRQDSNIFSNSRQDIENSFADNS